MTVQLTLTRFGRRDDWQTLKRFGGGVLRNSGWHLIDQALALFPSRSVPLGVLAQLARGLSPGDAEDYVKVVLKAADLPLIDIEVSDIAPFPRDAWTIVGTRGSLCGSPHELTWRWVVDEQIQPLTAHEGAAVDRAYRLHRPPFREAHWCAPTPRPAAGEAFYRCLYDSVRGGTPLAVTPESARCVMQVIEASQASEATHHAQRGGSLSEAGQPTDGQGEGSGR